MYNFNSVFKTYGEFHRKTYKSIIVILVYVTTKEKITNIDMYMLMNTEWFKQKSKITVNFDYLFSNKFYVYFDFDFFDLLNYILVSDLK